eukprot:m.28167 g.28167  ORF g.28167 m.28167 type:complete len:419 (+) comp6511_c0_seq1:61-1317(+)
MAGEREVQLTREDTSVSFGFALSSQKNGDKIVVTLYPEGLAAGKLVRGDKIVSINGTAMSGYDHDSMVTLIKGATELNMVVVTQAALVAVDWGTSSFRAWLVTARGQVLHTVQGDHGLLKLTKETREATVASFEQHLQAAVGKWMESTAGLRIVICGMAGSKQGWVEAPYASCPSSVESLVPYVVSVENSLQWPIFMVPGLTCRFGPSEGDVMRGEETQLLGLITRHKLADATVCLPGTHSKWVTVKDGAIAEFKTFMTGELFSVLSKHSILRYSLDGEGFGDQEEDEAAFLDGVRRGHASPEEVTHAMFTVRSRSLLYPEEATAAKLWAYLSGLLIGVELAGAKVVPKSTVYLIGQESLAARYASALSVLEVTVETVSAEHVAIVGMLRLLAAMPKPAAAEEEAAAAEDPDDSCVVM